MATRFGWLLALLLLVACDTDRNRSPAEPRSLSEADLDRLHVLGYEPWVEEPADAGRRTGVVLSKPEQIFPSYKLFANRGACEAVLLSPDGRIAHRWRGRAGGFWGDTLLLGDGTLLVVGATGTSFADQLTDRYLRALDWDSRVLWQSEFPAHHDVEITPDGKLLTLTFVDREVRRPQGSAWVVDDRVVLATSEGRKLEEYSLYDLFTASPELVDLRWRKAAAMRNGHLVIDAFHANSVEWIVAGERARTHPIYEDGNILVTVRHQNVIVVLDPRRRRLVWAWGSDQLQGPHQGRMLANGNVIVFDNGLGRKFSRVLEVDPRSGDIVWQYSGAGASRFFTVGGGGGQRLPNGNTLITETGNGQLFEVTPGGDVVWQFVNPSSDSRAPRRSTMHAVTWFPPAFVKSILVRHQGAG